MCAKTVVQGKTYNTPTAKECAFGIWRLSLTLRYGFRGIYCTKEGDYFVWDWAKDKWASDNIFLVSEGKAQQLIARLQAQDGMSLKEAIAYADRTADPSLD